MEVVNWIFFGPAKLVAVWPFAGITIGLALIAMQSWLSLKKGMLFQRNYFREAAVLAGLLWLIFNLYELQFAAVLAQNQIAGTLRMDLIILVPVLYVMTLAAMLSIYTQIRDRKPTN